MKEITIFNADATEYDHDEVKERIVENRNEGCYFKENGKSWSVDDITEEEVWEEIYSDIEMSYDAEKCNLNRELDGKVLCIASLGLWDGRKSGYRIMARNLNSILNVAQGDYYKVYADRYNVRATDPHHDGTNYYEFRELREDRNYDKLLNKLYNNEEVSRAEIYYYTKSLRPRIKEVYGI